jgi:hypothetical protein
MKRKAVEIIKDLCGGEIKYCSSRGNIVLIKVPYMRGKLIVEIDGETVETQVESFIEGVNGILDDMCTHLQDTKLSWF